MILNNHNQKYLKISNKMRKIFLQKIKFKKFNSLDGNLNMKKEIQIILINLIKLKKFLFKKIIIHKYINRFL